MMLEKPPFFIAVKLHTRFRISDKGKNHFKNYQAKLVQSLKKHYFKMLKKLLDTVVLRHLQTYLLGYCVLNIFFK